MLRCRDMLTLAGMEQQSRIPSLRGDRMTGTSPVSSCSAVADMLCLIADLSCRHDGQHSTNGSRESLRTDTKGSQLRTMLTVLLRRCSLGISEPILPRPHSLMLSEFLAQLAISNMA
jgi:hypothetical protein